jgi:hypothetical protein
VLQVLYFVIDVLIIAGVVGIWWHHGPAFGVAFVAAGLELLRAPAAEVSPA